MAVKPLSNAPMPAVSNQTRFKETEIGPLPEGWSVSSLGKLFDIQQGKAMSEESRKGPIQIPFLRTSNVLWGKIDLLTVDTMHFAEEEAKKYALRAEDLLVCEGGEVGRAAIWNNDLLGCLYQNHIHRLRRATDDIEPRFFMYWLQEAILHRNIYEGAANKTTIPNLSSARLKEFVVPLPPLPEQRAIAAVLSKIQSASETQGKIVSTLKELKSATMEKIFREGLRGQKLKETEIGPLPEGWDTTQLSKLCELHRELTQPSPNGNRCYVGLEHIDSGISELRRWGSERELLSTKARFYPGDILYGKLRPYLDKSVLIQTDGVCSTDILVLQPMTDKIDAGYISFLLHSNRFREHAVTTTKGLHHPRTSWEDIKRFECPLPPLAEQRAIAATLSKIDHSIETHRKTAEILQAGFSSMLDMLMTGKIRVDSELGKLNIMKNKMERE